VGFSDPEHPAVVITLVHGTWAPKAAWTREGSPLCAALRHAFPDAVLTRLRWSGGNTLRARRHAADALTRHLRSMIASHPNAHHFIITHSHGGNVAMYALRDGQLEGRIHGLVCLSTPFLHVRPRAVPPIAAFALVAAALMLPLIVREAAMDWCCPAAPLAADLVTVALAVASGVALIVLVPRAAARASAMLKAPAIDPDTCLLIRVAGDEASAALGALQLINWFTTVLWVKPAELLRAGYDAAVAWSATLARYTRHVVWVLAGALLSMIASVQLANAALPQFGSALWILGLAGLAVALIFAVVRAAPGHRLFYGFFLFGILFAPLPILLALVLVPFGPGLAPLATLLDVTAEPTPPGLWELHQLPTHAPATPVPLMHSASYQLPEAIELIVGWLRQRAASGSSHKRRP
jgi:hypothetical protein